MVVLAEIANKTTSQIHRIKITSGVTSRILQLGLVETILIRLNEDVILNDDSDVRIFPPFDGLEAFFISDL